MGSASTKLSPGLEEKVVTVFNQIDTDGSKTIDKEETLKFWRSNFAKLNTEELFAAVDADNNGSIELNEWLDFWRAVKEAGHTEAEIEEELEELMSGKSWVYFDKVKSAQKSD